MNEEEVANDLFLIFRGESGAEKLRKFKTLREFETEYSAWGKGFRALARTFISCDKVPVKQQSTIRPEDKEAELARLRDVFKNGVTGV